MVADGRGHALEGVDAAEHVCRGVAIVRCLPKPGDRSFEKPEDLLGIGNEEVAEEVEIGRGGLTADG